MAGESGHGHALVHPRSLRTVPAQFPITLSPLFLKYTASKVLLVPLGRKLRIFSLKGTEPSGEIERRFKVGNKTATEASFGG